MNTGSSLVDRAAASRFAGRRVLLTGASGFLGCHLARQGLAAEALVHALGRRPGPAGCVFVPADLTDAAAVHAAVASVRPEAVIHCAAPGVTPGSTTFAEMLAVAKDGTRALFAACAALSQRPPVVHVGSGFEYAAHDRPVDEDWPISPVPGSYGAAKAVASQVAQEFAELLPIAVLRPFHIYGAGEARRRLGPFIISQARRGAAIPLTGCEQMRDFLHVDDCAAMLWDALDRSAQSPGLSMRNLGSGVPLSLRDFVAATVAELAARGIDAKCELGKLPYREGEPMVSLPDITNWVKDQGRPARIHLAQGVADLVTAELAR